MLSKGNGINTGCRPGDDYNNHTDWLDVLRGWTVAYRKDDITCLRKPGKFVGVHGTINADGTDRFYCFTTATEFQQKYYDKFSVYAVLNHGGDFTAAAKDLATKGYGSRESTSKTVTSTADVTWDDPMWFGELRTPEIPSNLFPGIYGGYVDAVSKATQTPSGMAAMFMLSVLATSIQGKALVAPRPGSYHEPLQLWTLSASLPGSRKTAVMDHLLFPVTRWEAKKSREIQDRMAEAKTQRDVLERRIERLKQEAGKASSDEDRAELMRQIMELTEELPDEVTAVRLFSGDTNSEGLQKLLVENNGRMAIMTDEGAIFEVMGGMYSNGKVNINVFLQGHAGSPVRVDRAGRSVTIDHPCLTFGLVIQPEVVAKLSSNSKSTFRGNGCLARFLYCIPESNIGKRDIRKQSDIPAPLKAEYITAVQDLLNLPAPPDDSELPVITLNTEALNLWQDFAQWVEGELGHGGSMETFTDWGGKLAGAALRIAGLFHIAEYGMDAKQISATTMKSAIQLAELLIEHAKAAFDMMGADRETEDAKYLLKRIVNNREECFNRNQLHKQVHGKFPKVDKLIAALAVLTERGIISEPVNKATGRRPEILHYVNPKAWEMA